MEERATVDKVTVKGEVEREIQLGREVFKFIKRSHRMVRGCVPVPVR